MPNPGGIHLGCQRCRARKVKCDETSPACVRCIKYGLPCPGYPPQRDVRFRDETSNLVRRLTLSGATTPANSAAIRQSSRTGATKSHIISQTSRDATSTPDEDEEVVPRRSMSLVRWMAHPMTLACAVMLSNETVLTCYFFDQVLMPVGWYRHLPETYQNSPSGHCLRLTVTAAAMFLASHQLNDKQLLQSARRVYSSALQKVNQTLAHPERRLEDETLCAILILNVIDDINGQNSFKSGTHLDGCAQLLKARGDRGLWTEKSSDLAHSVVIQTQAQLVQDYQPNQESLKRWLCTQTSETPAAVLYQYCQQVGKFCSTSSTLLFLDQNVSSDLKISLYAVIQRGLELDSQMATWLNLDDSRWKFGTTEGPVVVDYYADIQVSKVWNQYRCARIALQEMILEAERRLRSTADADDSYLTLIRRESLATITFLLAGICSSIPFHLARVDSSGRPSSPHKQQVLGSCALLWPLGTVLQCKWSSQDQQSQARETLHEMGQLVGVQQAFNVAEVPLRPGH